MLLITAISTDSAIEGRKCLYIAFKVGSFPCEKLLLLQLVLWSVAGQWFARVLMTSPLTAVVSHAVMRFFHPVEAQCCNYF
jgi:hypothetical protein